MINIDSFNVRHHRTEKVAFGPVVHGTVAETSWRELTLTDMVGKTSTIMIWTSEGTEDERAGRLRVVGDPPVPTPEPVAANDYVEGDAC